MNRPRPPQSLRKRRGVAVMVVLVLCGLMSLMAVSLLELAGSTRTVSQGSSDKIQAEMLADNAVSLALAQLRAATSQTRAGTPKAWTSQPGGVRVHRMDGTLERLFKLYSAEKMVTSDASDAERDVPSDWAGSPDQYADLNEPRIIDGEPVYPIVDPRALSADPDEAVEGFAIDASRAPDGVRGAAGGQAAVYLPMPVRWLYQLKDGSLGTVDRAGRYQGQGTPSRENPITGRMAFWTDDESCKININTASEGAFWDTPRADTLQERTLAERQPLRNEYHRQPGHPAGVCLSSVLMPGQRFQPPGFRAESRMGGSVYRAMSTEDARALWLLGRLDCATNWEHTSLGGTRRPEIAVDRRNDTSPAGLHAPWYSLAELRWDNSRHAGDERQEQAVFSTHPETLARLQRSAFFLTTQSSAPETTLFGTPRIALWPVHGSTDITSPAHEAPVERSTEYDYRVALASTLHGRKYYVQRLRPGDGAWDLEKGSSGDNRTLFDYLRGLTDRAFPGWQRPGSGYTTFTDKYGAADRDAILLGMLDHIRSANFSDGQLPKENQFPILCPGNPSEGFGQVAPLSVTKTPTAPRGLGRMMTISEVALFFVCRAEVQADGKIKGEPSAQNRSKLKKPGDREVEAALLLESFVPSHGWADYRPYVSFSLTGGPRGADPDPAAGWPALTLNNLPMVPTAAKPTAQSSQEAPRDWTAWGGSAGVRPLMEKVITFRPVVIPASETLLTFSGSADPLNQLKLAVYDDPGSAASGRAGQGDLVQVIPLEFPPLGGLVESTVPVPALPAADIALTMEKRLRAAREGSPLLSNGDVVQSMVPAHGDYRVMGAQRRVEAAADDTRENSGHPVFVAHPQWGHQAMAHSLREPAAPENQAILGQNGARSPSAPGYIPGLPGAADFSPDAPAAGLGADAKIWAVVNGIPQQISAAELTDWARLDGGVRGPARPDLTGDFDNGLGNAPDGPYINRPDDGNLSPLASGGVPYFSGGRVSDPGVVPPVSPDVFSAHRLFPSAVAFGSLPTGAAVQVPWQTLLFRPQEQHFGGKTPPDHLLLDLFWSPVLDPEPYSRAFETEGKININHAMLPFSYIRRETALHAAMKAETMMAIPDGAAATYKSGGALAEQFRHYIDAAATLKLWREEVFSKGRVFLTAGEICSHYLIPEGSGARTADDMRRYWGTHRLTGDNSKERPYAHLHARLTTRSNVFRLHYIVQSLRQNAAGDAARFDSNSDAVTATVRGSCILRRELDAASPDIPDYAGPGAHVPLDAFYDWIIAERQQ